MSCCPVGRFCVQLHELSPANSRLTRAGQLMTRPSHGSPAYGRLAGRLVLSGLSHRVPVTSSGRDGPADKARKIHDSVSFHLQALDDKAASKDRLCRRDFWSFLLVGLRFAPVGSSA